MANNTITLQHYHFAI
jgi:hypothetical protein